MVSRVFRRVFVLLFFSLMLPLFTQNVSAYLYVEQLNDFTTHVIVNSNYNLLYDNQYHNSTELWEEIDAFESYAPDMIEQEIIGYSYLGKPIKAIKITNELRTNQKAKTLVVSHHHGREEISVEAAIRFIHRLVNKYDHNHFLRS